jgi:hypothetical protein
MQLIKDAERNRSVVMSRATLWEVAIAGSALLIAMAAQWILSTLIDGTNYYGLDGKLAQSAVLTAFKFGGYFDVTNLSPIQGVGSQMLPKNVWANPAFWPFAFFAKETATDISALIAFAIFATAVYLMMRCFDVPVLPSALAAQSSIILFAPALLAVHMPTNFCLTPGDAVVYAPYMLALGLLARLQMGSWRAFVLTTAGISALILYSIYCDPLWTMISAIGWAVPFAAVTVSPFHFKTIAVRAAALGCCLALLVLSGAAGYLYTLSQYTARVQFAEALDRVRDPLFISATVYWPTMTNLYLVFALGCLLGLVTLRGRARVLVFAATAAFAAWASYSVVYLLLNATWLPPIPLYLEQCLIPLYLAAAVAGFWGALPTVASLGARVARPLVSRAGAGRLMHYLLPGSAHSSGDSERQTWRFIAIVPLVLCLAIIPTSVVKYALPRLKSGLPPDPWSNEPELITFFAEKVGLAPGQPFRGALNFPPLDPVAANTVATLWSRSVATVNEYSQLVSPEALYFVRALLGQDVRTQLNRFDFFWSDHYSPTYWTVLQMLGARYFAAPWPLPDSVNPGLPLITKPHRPNLPDRPPGTWHVYELPHPNVGDYSPTEVATAGSGPEITAALSKPDFDFARQVVLSAPIAESLVPARNVRLSVIRGGLHVSGRSDGTSLVVLPQQFSHCLRARDPNVRLIRANLMLTAMVFSGDLDTDIVFDYGIFSPRCRRADLAEVKRLDLKIDLRVPHVSGDRLFPDWDGGIARLRAAAAAIRYAPPWATVTTRLITLMRRIKMKMTGAKERTE